MLINSFFLSYGLSTLSLFVSILSFLSLCLSILSFLNHLSLCISRAAFVLPKSPFENLSLFLTCPNRSPHASHPPTWLPSESEWHNHRTATHGRGCGGSYYGPQWRGDLRTPTDRPQVCLPKPFSMRLQFSVDGRQKSNTTSKISNLLLSNGVLLQLLTILVS